MVEMTDQDRLFYTAEEQKAIHEVAAIGAKEREEEKKRRAQEHRKEFYGRIEADELNTLSFLNQDISLLVKVREKFHKDGQLKALCEYHIHVNQIEIESTLEAIVNARTEAQRS